MTENSDNTHIHTQIKHFVKKVGHVIEVDPQLIFNTDL